MGRNAEAKIQKYIDIYIESLEYPIGTVTTKVVENLKKVNITSLIQLLKKLKSQSNSDQQIQDEMIDRISNMFLLTDPEQMKSKDEYIKITSDQLKNTANLVPNNDNKYNNIKKLYRDMEGENIDIDIAEELYTSNIGNTSEDLTHVETITNMIIENDLKLAPEYYYVL